MSDQLADLERAVLERTATVSSKADLEQLRTETLGRKGGALSRVMSSLAKFPASERAEFGRRANETKRAIESALNAALARLEHVEIQGELSRIYDPTFPGTTPRAGSLHLLRQTLDDVVNFFRSRGFAVVLGPEVESEYYAFEAVNIPADHPARDNMDTFYLPNGSLLRPHTSSMQVRSLKSNPPPVAVLAPGRVYRRDALDASHSFMFHQIEGLHVDRGVNFGHLKGFAADLCRHLFGADRRTRFRPSYFQFTEPSAEVDVSCGVCGGRGCQTCKGTGWLEMGGSGMVHPNVLRAAGYDPEEFSGWAFGLGTDRIAMLRHDIHDIRTFFENDPRFLEQFA